MKVHCINTSTRSDAGLLINALENFPFLCFLSFWKNILNEINDTQKYLQTKGLNIQQCDKKLEALKVYLSTNREELVTNAVIYAKAICEENEIEIVRRSRCRQKNTQCVEISYETEIRREMFSSIDRIIQEIKTRFEQIHNLSNKFSFLFPKNLLDSNFLCNLTNDFEGDINVHEFYIERKRLQCFFFSP